MLRRRERVEVFTAIFLKAGRRGHGRSERDAGIFAARRGCYAHAEQEAARRAISARRRGWSEYRGAFWRIQLLPHASDDCDTQPKRGGTDAAIDLDGFFG